MRIWLFCTAVIEGHAAVFEADPVGIVEVVAPAEAF